MKRVLTTLMSGASLGGISYEPNAPATGYIAFLTLALYFVGLLLLPRPPLLAGAPPPSGRRQSARLPVILCCARGAAACRKAPAAPSRRRPAARRRRAARRGADVGTAGSRAALGARLAAAGRPDRAGRLEANPPGPEAWTRAVVECKLVVKSMGGTTPKFDCELAGHDVIRVKYGRGNPELHAEIAATRLLTALGFGADHMYRSQRCAAPAARVSVPGAEVPGQTGIESACFAGGVDYSSITEFDYVSIERRLEGRRIEFTPDQGWAFYEIDQGRRSGRRLAAGARRRAEAARGPHRALGQQSREPAAALPARRRPAGRRLCEAVRDPAGPRRVVRTDQARSAQLASTPVWADARACRVSMKQMPWGGATFPEQRISEAGVCSCCRCWSSCRRATAGSVRGRPRGALGRHHRRGRAAGAWAAAFLDKVRQIREAGPCEALTDPKCELEVPTTGKSQCRRKLPYPNSQPHAVRGGVCLDTWLLIGIHLGIWALGVVGIWSLQLGISPARPKSPAAKSPRHPPSPRSG